MTDRTAAEVMCCPDGCEKGTMPLTNGGSTLLSGSDLERAIKAGRWFSVKKRGYHYVCRCFGKDNRIYLHRWLINAPQGMQVDHINGDTLDNRRENLRIVTHAQNQRNRAGAQVNSKTGVRGVHPFRDKFEASTRHYGRTIHIGLFYSIEEAAIARRKWETDNWDNSDRYRAMTDAGELK